LTDRTSTWKSWSIVYGCKASIVRAAEDTLSQARASSSLDQSDAVLHSSQINQSLPSGQLYTLIERQLIVRFHSQIKSNQSPPQLKGHLQPTVKGILLQTGTRPIQEISTQSETYTMQSHGCRALINCTTQNRIRSLGRATALKP